MYFSKIGKLLRYFVAKNLKAWKFWLVKKSFAVVLLGFLLFSSLKKFILYVKGGVGGVLRNRCS